MLTVMDVAEKVGRRGPLDSDAVRRDMAAVLGRVPHDAVSHVGFESRLVASERQVDFLLGFGRADVEGLRLSAAALLTQSSANEAIVLRGLCAFADRWERNERLGTDISHLWLEYDGNRIHEGRRPPGVFLESGPIFQPGRDPSAWVSDRYRDINGMSGYEVPATVAREVDRCLDACPSHVKPATVGFFLGRPHSGLRVCLAGFDLWGATEYLKRIGHDGDASRFMAELIDIRAGAAGILEEIGMVHLDVGPGRLGDRVGIELVFEVNRQVSQHRLDTDVLDALVRKRLADRAKCRELAAWPGAAGGPDGESLLYIRRVNHIKLVFARDRVVEAKAYFGIRRGLPEFVPLESVGPLDEETP